MADRNICITGSEGLDWQKVNNATKGVANEFQLPQASANGLAENLTSRWRSGNHSASTMAMFPHDRSNRYTPIDYPERVGQSYS